MVLCASVLVFAATPAFAQDDTADLARTLVNKTRAAEGLTALSTSAVLQAAAQAHAGDMAARDFYAHETPEGATPRDRYLAAGGGAWHFVAENIARCTRCDPSTAPGMIRRFHTGWLESPGHRKNILRRGAETFGFGIASRGITTYAVQMFAGSGAPDGPPDAASAPAPVAELRRAALDAINAQREQSGYPALKGDPALAELARRIAARTTFAGGDMTLPRNAYSLMPEVGADWSHLATAARACSGCGTQPTVSDASKFAPRLTHDIGAEYTHVGFALVADGEGRKIAIALFARP